MPNHTDEIKLPQFSRPIGVLRDRITTASAAVEVESIGVLAPFAGVLNGLLTRGESVFPAFSYLTLRSLAIRGASERDDRSVEAGRPAREDEAGEAGERRVYHLLRNDPAEHADRSSPSQSADRSAPSRAPGSALTPKADTWTTERQRREFRPSPSEHHDDRLVPLRNITVLELPNTEAPGTDRARRRSFESERNRGDAKTRRRGDSAAGKHPAAARPSEAGGSPALSYQMMMSSITNTTLRQSAVDPPEPRPAVVQFGESESAQKRSDPDSTGDGTTEGDLETALGRDRSPVERGPELTLATVTTRMSEEPRGGGDSEVRGAEPEERSGSDVEGGSPSGRTELENGGPRLRSHAPVASILDDRQQMNRFVDRVYRELEKKTRIERERRGL